MQLPPIKTKPIKVRFFLLVFLCLTFLTKAQDFITQWGGFTAPTTTLRFHALTTGAVNYTWVAQPSGNTGTGSFTQAVPGLVTLGLNIPAGNIVTISMAPTNLKRFILQPNTNAINLYNVLQWGAVNWTSMEAAFAFCVNLNITATDIPDLSIVTDMSYMFWNCNSLNGPSNIGTWNTSHVNYMIGTFENATNFNQPIGTWNTSSVRGMEGMFYQASNFNQPIGTWNTSAVKNMNYMFYQATNFNQNIGMWNTGAVINMFDMFRSASAFNQNIGAWNTANVINMSNMFDSCGMDCLNYTETLNGWSNNPLTGSNINLGAVGIQYGNDAINARNNLTTVKGWTITGDAPSGHNCGYFKTKWSGFTALTNTLRFNALTSGAVNYTWAASPSGNTGSGSFNAPVAGMVTLSGLSIPAGNTVTLSMEPTNLQRFFFGTGTDANKLTDVLQWGGVNWTSMLSAFINCTNLNITASDVPNLSGVTTMTAMFQGCSSLNGPTNIGTWNTSSVTTMVSTFRNASVFNQAIGNWNTVSVTNMSTLFTNAAAFNQDISGWNTSSVTSMSSMFNGATNFNQPIGSWLTGAVTNMGNMFANASSFNQDISTWYIGSVTDMGVMFNNATSFNQPLNNWNTSNVNNMSGMFLNASAFNQYLGSWVINAANNVSNMFNNCGMSCLFYSQTLIDWNNNPLTASNKNLGALGVGYSNYAASARSNLITIKNWTIVGDSPGTCGDSFITKWQFIPTQNLTFNTLTTGLVNYTYIHIPSGIAGSGTFQSNIAGPVTLNLNPIFSSGTLILSMEPSNLKRFYMGYSPLVSSVYLRDVLQWGSAKWSSMEDAFNSCWYFDISANDIPNLSSVVSLAHMFDNCRNLIGPANINAWDLSNVTDVSGMFFNAELFNQGLDTWNTSSVTHMSYMFSWATEFNQPIDAWNTNSVTDMSGMFYEATNFNQPLGNWNTKFVTDMSVMFAYASNFDQALDTWNTESVTNMGGIFSGAANFNQPLDTWNTLLVTNMSFMFSGAIKFDQPLNNWNTSMVTNMSGMFYNASSFNQPIGNWDVSSVINMSYMFYGATSFNQFLGSWILNNNVNTNNMLFNCGMNCENYSNTLSGWHANNPTVINRNLGTVNLFYNSSTAVTRANFSAATPTGRGWTITGDALMNPAPLLVPVSTNIAAANSCDYYINPGDQTKKVLSINANGNSFNHSTAGVNVYNAYVSSLPASVTTINSGGTGYYQINNSGETMRISRRMFSVQAPGSYVVNGGVLVRVYLNNVDTINIRTDAFPMGSLSDYGWFKSSYHTAQDVVNDMAASFPSLSNAQKIQATYGVENGVRYAEFKVQNFSTFGYYAKTLPGVLPVELLYFNSECNDGDLKFNWATASEINNSHFIVEASEDGIEWKAISQVTGNGQSYSLINYETIIPEAEVRTLHYFRLRQVDTNGDEKIYDNVKYIESCKADAFEVYPNPSNGIINVKGESMQAYELYNSLGEIVNSNNISNDNLQLDIKQEGVFMLKIRFNSGKVLGRKVIVKN